MRKGKIKAVLFIIVFLLVMATAITLLLDMERERREVEQLGYDPYAHTPAPTAAPTVTPMPVSTIRPTPVPTPTPTPVPTPPPTPVPTPPPTPTPLPPGTFLDSGSFRSEMSVPLNLRADWTARVLDANRVYVKVEVYLESYSLQITAAHNAVNVSVGDHYLSADTPTLDIEDSTTRHSSLIAVTEHSVPLADGTAGSFPVQVQYIFRGTYFRQNIDTIECGGTITLAR